MINCCHFSTLSATALVMADLARAHDYNITVEKATDSEGQKSERGIPLELTSCRTIETIGYVPLEELETVLQDRLDIAGLAVPCMPMGSSGIGDDPSTHYDVIAFGGEAGTGTVYYRAGKVQPFDT